MSLKQLKQDFVSDLVGGSLSEIYLVVLVSIVSYLVFKILQLNNLTSPIIDFLLNVVLLLASITVYSNDISTLYKSLIGPLIVLLAYQMIFANKKKPAQKLPQKNLDILQQKPFITAYRSHMLILTNFAILAVDFHIFPRRFAKVETWGTSLMDMGVGSFVFSMGLVNSRSIIKQKLSNSKSSQKYGNLVVSNIKKSIPMLVIGFIRFLSVKGLEYQEHETEYGIHWNFFFTLGFLPIFIAILNPLFEILPRFLIALLITGGYEFALCKVNLLTFILRTDNRLDNIITMNKEGIFSFFGYLSIFIFGQSFGSFVLTSHKTANNLIGFDPKSRTIRTWLTVSTTTGLLVSTIVYHLIAIFLKESSNFHNISRRLANMPYVFMIVAYNSFFLLAYNLCDKFFGIQGPSSPILEAVNRNGLVEFLIGNLCTGLVNMTINTLECDLKTSFLILLAYGTTVISVAVVLDKLNIYVKI